MTKSVALGIDIGGTKISAACVFEGKILGDVYKTQTPNSPVKITGVVHDIIDLFTETSKYKFNIVGIATAGVVDIEKGQVKSATENLALGYAGVNFRRLIEEKYKYFCFVDNDANAAAFAEYKFGAARGTTNALMLTYGTGVGAGIIINGDIYRGNNYFAGECGHLNIDIKDGRACTCGGTGCYEAYAAGRGLEKTYQQLVLSAGSTKKPASCKEILVGVKNLDEFCIQAYLLWHQHISAGILNLVYVLSPEVIVLGGGLSKFIDISKIQPFIKEKFPYEVNIVKATFDNDSGILGSAALAESEYFKKK